MKSIPCPMVIRLRVWDRIAQFDRGGLPAGPSVSSLLTPSDTSTSATNGTFNKVLKRMHYSLDVMPLWQSKRGVFLGTDSDRYFEHTAWPRGCEARG